MNLSPVYNDMACFFKKVKSRLPNAHVIAIKEVDAIAVSQYLEVKPAFAH